MKLTDFLVLVSNFREVYFTKTQGEVVMLVARGEPSIAAKAKACAGTELDCSTDDRRIWAFLKHVGIA